MISDEKCDELFNNGVNKMKLSLFAEANLIFHQLYTERPSLHLAKLLSSYCEYFIWIKNDKEMPPPKVDNWYNHLDFVLMASSLALSSVVKKENMDHVGSIKVAQLLNWYCGLFFSYYANDEKYTYDNRLMEYFQRIAISIQEENSDDYIKLNFPYIFLYLIGINLNGWQ